MIRPHTVCLAMDLLAVSRHAVAVPFTAPEVSANIRTTSKGHGLFAFERKAALGTLDTLVGSVQHIMLHHSALSTFQCIQGTSANGFCMINRPSFSRLDHDERSTIVILRPMWRLLCMPDQPGEARLLSKRFHVWEEPSNFFLSS